MLGFAPSLVASTAVYITNKRTWSPLLESVTSYNTEDLRGCLESFDILLSNVNRDFTTSSVRALKDLGLVYMYDMGVSNVGFNEILDQAMNVLSTSVFPNEKKATDLYKNLSKIAKGDRSLREAFTSI